MDKMLQTLHEVREFWKQEEQEQLYQKLYTAITEERYSSMRDIIQQTGYAPDRVSGEDKRTALHTAAQVEDIEALDILLQQDNVDCNVPDLEGLTPAMLAAREIKIDSFERLLEDPRVSVKARTKKNNNCFDLLPVHALSSERERFMIAFQAAKNKPNKSTQNRRVAIIIANSDYEESSGFSRLPGAKEDLEKLTNFLKKNSYHIIPIVNAQDIEARVTEEMERLDPSFLPVTHFQLVYSGISTYGSFPQNMEL